MVSFSILLLGDCAMLARCIFKWPKMKWGEKRRWFAAWCAVPPHFPEDVSLSRALPGWHWPAKLSCLWVTLYRGSQGKLWVGCRVGFKRLIILEQGCNAKGTLFQAGKHQEQGEHVETPIKLKLTSASCVHKAHHWEGSSLDIHGSSSELKLYWKWILFPKCVWHRRTPHQPSWAAKPLGSLLTWPTQMLVTFNTDGTISDGCFAFVCKTRHSLRCSELLRMTIHFKKKKKGKCLLIRTHFLYAVRTEPGRMNTIPYFNPWGNLLQRHFTRRALLILIMPIAWANKLQVSYGSFFGKRSFTLCCKWTH